MTASPLQLCGRLVQLDGMGNANNILQQWLRLFLSFVREHVLFVFTVFELDHVTTNGAER